MTIEIVSFPIKHGGSFHGFLYVYQMHNYWFTNNSSTEKNIPQQRSGEPPEPST